MSENEEKKYLEVINENEYHSKKAKYFLRIKINWINKCKQKLKIRIIKLIWNKY